MSSYIVFRYFFIFFFSILCASLALPDGPRNFCHPSVKLSLLEVMVQ